jgi:hypothetical protein
MSDTFSHFSAIAGYAKIDKKNDCSSSPFNGDAFLPGTKKSSPELFRELFLSCTRSRDRTGTVLLPLVFETSASTNSAIRAALEVIIGKAKINICYRKHK